MLPWLIPALVSAGVSLLSDRDPKQALLSGVLGGLSGGMLGGAGAGAKMLGGAAVKAGATNAAKGLVSNGAKAGLSGVLPWLTKNSGTALAIAGIGGQLLSGAGKGGTPQAPATTGAPARKEFVAPQQQFNPITEEEAAGYGRPGGMAEKDFFKDFAGYKDGGMIRSAAPGDVDTIPANAGKKPIKLAGGEYIFPATAVSNIGGGNSEAGAAILDKLKHAALKKRFA